MEEAGTVLQPEMLQYSEEHLKVIKNGETFLNIVNITDIKVVFY